MIPPAISAKVPSLREKYGDIYLLDTSELHVDKLTSFVVIRPLTRREFNSFSEDYDIDPISSMRLLIKRCMIHGSIDDGYLAGIDEYVASAINIVSGFSSEEELVQGVESARTEALTLESAIALYICQAFPVITPKDVDNMTFAEQMRYTALAEQILQRPLPYDEFLNPGKPKLTKPPKHMEPPAPPPGYVSHGGKQPPPPRPDQEVTVTPENLHAVMGETRKLFGR